MTQKTTTTSSRRNAPQIIHPVEEGVVPDESELLIVSPTTGARRHLLYPLRIGRFTYRPGFELVRSRFDSFLLGIVREGTLHATIWLDDEPTPYDVAAGSVFLFDTYLKHEGRADETTRTSMIHFDGAPARLYYERIVGALGNVFPVGNPALMENSIDRLLDAYTSDQTRADLIGARILTDLLTGLALRTPAAADDDMLAVRETLSYLDDHYRDPITVDALAQRASLSPRQYLRKFKTLTGRTPYAYLTIRRMDEARRLLSTTAMPVRQVASAVGYPSLNTFTRAFRQRSGMTPMLYRAGHHAG